MLLSPCCKTVSQMFRLGEHTASECCKHYKLEPNHVVVCFHLWLESVHWILGSQHVCKDESESAISNLDVILSKLRNLLFKKRTWMLCEESCHLLTTFDFRMWSTSILFQICWQGLGGKGGFSKDWFFALSQDAGCLRPTSWLFPNQWYSRHVLWCPLSVLASLKQCEAVEPGQFQSRRSDGNLKCLAALAETGWRFRPSNLIDAKGQDYVSLPRFTLDSCFTYWAWAIQSSMKLNRRPLYCTSTRTSRSAVTLS